MNTRSIAIGQTIHVSIVVGQRTDVLAVPAAAIHDGEDGAELHVVREGAAVVLHPKLGATQDGWVEVSGAKLTEGDQVIVEGSYHLPEGTHVTAESSAASAAEPATKGDASKSHP